MCWAFLLSDERLISETVCHHASYMTNYSSIRSAGSDIVVLQREFFGARVIVHLSCDTRHDWSISPTNPLQKDNNNNNKVRKLPKIALTSKAASFLVPFLNQSVLPEPCNYGSKLLLCHCIAYCDIHIAFVVPGQP